MDVFRCVQLTFLNPFFVLCNQQGNQIRICPETFMHRIAFYNFQGGEKVRGNLWYCVIQEVLREIYLRCNQNPGKVKGLEKIRHEYWWSARNRTKCKKWGNFLTVMRIICGGCWYHFVTCTGHPLSWSGWNWGRFKEWLKNAFRDAFRRQKYFAEKMEAIWTNSFTIRRKIVV